MKTFDLEALKLWNAVHFRRRAPDRDQRHAIKVLLELVMSKNPAIKRRAEEALKEPQ